MLRYSLTVGIEHFNNKQNLIIIRLIHNNDALGIFAGFINIQQGGIQEFVRGRGVYGMATARRRVWEGCVPPAQNSELVQVQKYV